VASDRAGSKGWRSSRRPVSPVTPDDQRSKTYGATGNRPSSRRHVPTRIPAARRSAGRGREAYVSVGFGPKARPARPPHELHRDVSAESENPQGRTSRRQVREIEKRGPEVTKGRSGNRPGGWRLRTLRTRAWPANAEGAENLKSGARHLRLTVVTSCSARVRGTGRVGPVVCEKEETGPARSASAGRLIRLPAGRSRAIRRRSAGESSDDVAVRADAKIRVNASGGDTRECVSDAWKRPAKPMRASRSSGRMVIK